MTWRQWTIQIMLFIYILVACSLTIYHAYNFTDYTNIKGDEIFDYIKYLLWASILFQVPIWAITKKLNWEKVFLATIGKTVLSSILGLLIIVASGLSGIPRHLIFVYGACFMAIFTLVTIKQIRKTKIN